MKGDREDEDHNGKSHMNKENRKKNLIKGGRLLMEKHINTNAEKPQTHLYAFTSQLASGELHKHICNHGVL